MMYRVVKKPAQGYTVNGKARKAGLAIKLDSA